MPRIIVKCRYYQSEKTRKSIGGLLRYIAKREGVDKLNDKQKNKPATEKQKECIDQFVNVYKSIVNMPEYSAFEKSNTRGDASELIAAVIEMHPELLSGKTYLDYIATRPRVERISGSHGLFGDEGSVLDLADEVRKMEAYSGNVYSVIISIKREDAERLSYNNAEKWRDMIRANKDVIAKAHGIPLDKLCWYGAFHNEKHHPHVHLMLYSKDDINHGYLNNKGIELMRKTFGKEIFRADLQEIYDRQTQYRNLLTSEAIEEFDSLADSIKFGLCYNPMITQKVADLAARLQSVKGKKVYGYLPLEVKRQVDDIVVELEKDETVKRLYDSWYLAKCEVENTYTDHFSPQLPLAEENVFKSIRNAVIKRAFELGKELNDTNTENKKTDKGNSTNNTIPYKRPTNTAASSVVQTKVITVVSRLGKDISNIFRQEFDGYVNDPSLYIDSKLRREIEAKKKGQNISM
jgi:hypothetical protein